MAMDKVGAREARLSRNEYALRRPDGHHLRRSRPTSTLESDGHMRIRSGFRHSLRLYEEIMGMG
jgi:hypothetical protein